MADVREMLARLNQQTIRCEVGRGGVAELSNQDLTAALAFVEPGRQMGMCQDDGRLPQFRLGDSTLEEFRRAD